MPKIKSKQIDVITPVNPTDIVDKQYVDNIIHSNSGNSNFNLSIKDENILVSTGVTSINFIGTDVYSRFNYNTNTVDVFIPSVVLTPGLDSLSSNFITYNRYISDPIIEDNPFNKGNWTTGVHSVVNSQEDISYYSNLFGFSNENTYLNISIYKITGNTNSEVLLFNRSASTFGNINNFVNNIEVRLNSFNTESNKYVNRIDSIKFYLNYILPNGGRFRMKINLIDDNYTYNFVSTDIFYDTNYFFNETYGFNISGLTIVENPSNVVYKYISGVKYYTSGSTFIVNINNIQYPNYLTYITPQIVIDGSEFNLSNLNLSTSNLSGWTNYFNNNNISYYNNMWVVENTRFYALTNTAKISTHSVDWYNNINIFSDNYNMAIDTIFDISDRNTEDFSNENFRLKSNLTLWDSSESLLTIDGGNGLQLYNSRLYYPTIVYFNQYKPYELTQPDYSLLTGDKSYYRQFIGSGFSSNGCILFTDHNLLESDINDSINSNILISISIDSGLTWFSLNDEFLTLPINDGEGCRTNKDLYNIDLNSRIQFTLGISSSENFIIRIIYKDNPITKTKYIGCIDIIDGNWV